MNDIDFCQCHVGWRHGNKQFISIKWVGPMPIRTQLLKEWVGPDPEKDIGSTPLLVTEDLGCD